MMPTVFTAKLDGSESTRYFHISLVTFYLNQASIHAHAAKDEKDFEKKLSLSIIAITFSAMTLEALANERGESIFEKAELQRFIHLRKEHKKLEGECSINAKLRIILEKTFNSTIPEELAVGIESLVHVRNEFTHYKYSDTAGSIHFPPTKPIFSEDGVSGKILFNLLQEPERIEPPFIQSVSPKAAASAYNTALRFLRYWNSLAGHSESLTELTECS